jgi:hypothetical protein
LWTSVLSCAGFGLDAMVERVWRERKGWFMKRRA